MRILPQDLILRLLDEIKSLDVDLISNLITRKQLDISPLLRTVFFRDLYITDYISSQIGVFRELCAILEGLDVTYLWRETFEYNDLRECCECLKKRPKATLQVILDNLNTAHIIHVGLRSWLNNRSDSKSTVVLLDSLVDCKLDLSFSCAGTIELNIVNTYFKAIYFNQEDFLLDLRFDILQLDLIHSIGQVYLVGCTPYENDQVEANPHRNALKTVNSEVSIIASKSGILTTPLLFCLSRFLENIQDSTNITLPTAKPSLGPSGDVHNLDTLRICDIMLPDEVGMNEQNLEDVVGVTPDGFIIASAQTYSDTTESSGDCSVVIRESTYNLKFKARGSKISVLTPVYTFTAQYPIEEDLDFRVSSFQMNNFSRIPNTIEVAIYLSMLFRDRQVCLTPEQQCGLQDIANKDILMTKNGDDKYDTLATIFNLMKAKTSRFLLGGPTKDLFKDISSLIPK